MTPEGHQVTAFQLFKAQSATPEHVQVTAANRRIDSAIPLSSAGP